MTGELLGGWSYVWAAYAVVWLGLVAYGASVAWRYHAATAAPSSLLDAEPAEYDGRGQGGELGRLEPQEARVEPKGDGEPHRQVSP